MNNPLYLQLESRLKLFDEHGIGTYTNEYGYVHKIPNYDKLKHFLISSFISSWEKEVERKRGMKKCSTGKVPKQIIDEEDGFNSAVLLDIQLLEEAISEARKLL